MVLVSPMLCRKLNATVCLNVFFFCVRDFDLRRFVSRDAYNLQMQF